MRDAGGREFHALAHATRLKVGQVGEWPVTLADPGGTPIEGRVIATKLPAPVAAKAERRAAKKNKVPDPRSLQAAHFVMVFTTLSTAMVAATVAAGVNHPCQSPACGDGPPSSFMRFARRSAHHPGFSPSSTLSPAALSVETSTTVVAPESRSRPASLFFLVTGS